MKTARTIMMLMAWLCAGLAVDAATAPTAGWARSRTPHAPHIKTPHISKPHLKRLRAPRRRTR